MKRYSLLIICALLAGTVSAQYAADSVSAKGKKTAKTVQKKSKAEKEVLPSVTKFNQLIEDYRQVYQESDDRWNDFFSSDLMPWVRLNPDYYKLFVPATYYQAPIEEDMSLGDWKPSIPFLKGDPVRDSLSQAPNITPSVNIDRAVNKQLLDIYLRHPNVVQRNENDLKDLEPLSEKMRVKSPRKEKVNTLVESPTSVRQVSESELLVMKPNFWDIKGNGYIQASQNYISDNWYKGGESTVSLLSGLTWQFNYDDKQRLQFENKLEWKLGFITAPSDTVHQYKTNNDLLRLTSKLGYEAFKNWYYTISAEFKTQLFSQYSTNSDVKKSAFLSPAELNIGIGMDYKYKKNNVINLSVLINPLNYTRYSVWSDEVDPTKFNIEAGKKVSNQFGSRMEATMKWSVITNLLWDSRLSYTTNYSKVVSEWENTFTFAFNKYFSTKLFVHVRYDDSVTRKEGESFFQLQELMSLGFNYTW